DATEQMDAKGDPWSIDRIDQTALPLSGTYAWTRTAAGVHAYIIDAGIWTMHPDFGGRADEVYDVASVLGINGQDCNGHGTHVAGTVGSATYGVAKGVFLHGVRVFAGCLGTGFAPDVIAGVDWVTANHQSPAVANMSIAEQGTDDALNTATTNLVNSGVFVAVAAGNYSVDACGYSPGNAPGAFTVAASTKTDAAASFTDFGPCVQIYAPGDAIKSTWILNGTQALSGTSRATPHVDPAPPPFRFAPRALDAPSPGTRIAMIRTPLLCATVFVGRAACAVAQRRPAAPARSDTGPTAPPSAPKDSLTRFLESFSYRNLGPAAYSGRVTALAVPSPKAGSYPNTFYVGAAGGGVWKTTNGGTTWQPVSEGLGP